ncbi:MAG: tetratricopeptide repeat protein [Planctomycetes bacterium]|nr:tetratricopeptide repeat protein [Planctomycetota bacterium]
MADEIHLRSGEVLSGGQVTQETWAEVKYAGGGATRALPAWKVARIVHGDACADLDLGLENVQAGRFDEALSAFERVRQAGAAVPAWAPSYAAFHRANTLRTQALIQEEGAEDAAAALVEFTKAHPQSMHVPAAHYALGDLSLARGDGAGARAAFQRMDEKQYGIAWNLLGFFGKARATLAEGKAGEAEALFRALAEQAERVEGCGEVHRLTTLGRAQAIRALGKPEESIRLVEPFLADEGWTNAPVTAQLLNYVGETVLEMGGTPDHALTAIPLFLRVVRYFPGYHLEFGRALFLASRCFRTLESAEWAEAAVDAVKENYPRSTWAKKAG